MPGVPPGHAIAEVAMKRDADYVFFELTRSICPVCRVTIDAYIGDGP